MPKVLCSEFGRSFKVQRARAVVFARLRSLVARGRRGSGRGALAARVLCGARGSAPDRRARFSRERSLCLPRGSFGRSVPSAGSTSSTSSPRSVRFGPYRARPSSPRGRLSPRAWCRRCRPARQAARSPVRPRGLARPCRAILTPRCSLSQFLGSFPPFVRSAASQPRFGSRRGLTHRSSGLAPAGRLWPSFHSGPNPPCLREPLNSNVRRRKRHGAARHSTLSKRGAYRS